MSWPRIRVAIVGAAALAFDFGCALSAYCAQCSATTDSRPPSPAPSPSAVSRKLEMLERREIPALVPPISRTLYDSDKRRERGIAVEVVTSEKSASRPPPTSAKEQFNKED